MPRNIHRVYRSKDGKPIKLNDVFHLIWLVWSSTSAQMLYNHFTILLDEYWLITDALAIWSIRFLSVASDNHVVYISSTSGRYIYTVSTNTSSLCEKFCHCWVKRTYLSIQNTTTPAAIFAACASFWNKWNNIQIGMICTERARGSSRIILFSSIFYLVPRC